MKHSDVVHITLPNPALEAVPPLSSDSYSKAFVEIAEHLVTTQVTLPRAECPLFIHLDDLRLVFACRDDSVFILRSGNHSTVQLSPKAAALAIEICTFNWMGFKLAERGQPELAKMANKEFLCRIRKLYYGRSGISKTEVALIQRYLD